MIEQTGADYMSSKHLKMLAVSGAKEGKTSFLTASALGALPWQKYGGLVTSPENLHVIALDANALGGLRAFLTTSCKKPESYLKFTAYNLQNDVRGVGKGEWDFTLFNTMGTVMDRITNKIARGGTHAVLMSSLTGLARGIQRGIAGPPLENKKGSGMDASKWQSLESQLSEIQNMFQADTHHMLWEAHIDKAPEFLKNKLDDSGPKETIQVTGKAGRWWAFNVEQVVRLRREHGNRMGLVDKVYMDTRPSADFLSGGRSFTEKLDAKEYDLTAMALKLGLAAGRYGYVKK